LLFLVLFAALLLDDRAATNPDATPPVATSRELPAQPVADPVLSAARAALAAGRYEAPPGRNALDLFAAVLLARPEHTEARAGLDETAARLMALATSKVQAGEEGEARRLVERVMAVDAGHAAARALQARLDMPTAPATEPPVSLAKAPAQAISATAAAPPAPAAATPSAPPVQAAPPAAIVAAQPTRAAATREPSRTFGPPVASGHPTAGYVRPPSAAEPVVLPPDQSKPTDATVWLPDQDLEQLTATEPVYPRAALRDRVEGWVEIDYTVTESGSVRDIEIVAAEPQGVFEASAKAAVGQWRFRPRVANGRPVPQRSSVTLRFNVEG
jgi:protein TonB